jgi:AraC-like DNA-binding protein
VVEASSKLSLGAFRRYSAHPEEVTIVPPYTVHTEVGDWGEPTRWQVLYVAPSFLDRVFGSRKLLFPGPVVTHPTAAEELRNLLWLSTEGAISGAEFVSRVARWMESLLDRSAGDTNCGRRTLAVELARTFLQDRPTEPVSLPDIGAAAGANLSHLIRSFSRSVGLPPKSYHAQIRLARARRLLADGKSATWVAYECGFADQSHLSRRFKQSYGVTPGAFQTQYRGDDAVTGTESSAP